LDRRGKTTENSRERRLTEIEVVERSGRSRQHTRHRAGFTGLAGNGRERVIGQPDFVTAMVIDDDPSQVVVMGVGDQEPKSKVSGARAAAGGGGVSSSIAVENSAS
jgi:hypothetical protein